MLLYRPMREYPYDKRPLVVDTARGLGIRPGEIPEDEEGFVEPGNGGMSVALENPEFLPSHRRPIALGGTGVDPLWSIEEADLGDALAVRPDPEIEGHGFVEPGFPMFIDDYRDALAETRDLWRRWS